MRSPVARAVYLAVALVMLWHLQPAPTALSDGKDGRLYFPAIDNRPSPSIDQVDRVGGKTAAVAVVGDHALLGIGSRVVPYRLRGDSSPVETGDSIALPGIVTRIVVSGGRAYAVTDEDRGLHVLDVESPGKPRLIGQVGAVLPVDIAISGDRAVVCESRQALVGQFVGDTEFEIAQSIEVWRHEVSATHCVVGDSGALIVAGERVGIGYGGYYDLLGFDLTTSEDPPLTFDYVAMAFAALAVEGDEARFVHGLSAQSLDLGDASKPELGARVSLHNVIAAADLYGGRVAVASRGDAFHVAGSDGLAVLDMSAESVIGEAASSGRSYRMALSGDRVIIAGLGLSAFDVTDSADPTQAWSVAVPGEIEAVATSGDHVFAVEVHTNGGAGRLAEATWNGESIAIDRWRLLDEVGRASGTDVVASDHVVAVLANGAIQVFDRRDPESDLPVLVSLPASEEGVYRSLAMSPDGKYVYASLKDEPVGDDGRPTWFVGLDAVDVSNPAHPMRIGETEITPVCRRGLPYITDFAATATHVYLTYNCRFGWMRVIYEDGGSAVAVDVTDPADPRQTGQYAHRREQDVNIGMFPGLFSVGARGPNVYVGTENEVLQLLADQYGELRHVGSHLSAEYPVQIETSASHAIVLGGPGWRQDGGRPRRLGSIQAVDMPSPSVTRNLASASGVRAVEVAMNDHYVWAASAGDGLTLYTGP